MPKRGAIAELNHDNWDDEEEKEDPGRFVTAKKDDLQTRVIKKAKRRTSEVTAGVFKSFTGFVSSSSTTTSGNGAAGRGGATALGSLFSTDAADHPKPSVPNNNRVKHLNNLRALNTGVVKWIQEHVARDPYCDLSPVFSDYSRHLAEIEKRFPFSEAVKETEAEGKKKEAAEKTSSTATFQIGDSDLTKTAKSLAAEVPVSISAKGASDSGKQSAAFKFGPLLTTCTTSTSSTTTKATPFSFGTDATLPKFQFSSDTSTTAPASKLNFGVEKLDTTAGATTTSTTATKPLFQFGLLSSSAKTPETTSAADSDSSTGETSKPMASLFQFGASSGSASAAAKPFSFSDSTSSAGGTESKPAATTSLFAVGATGSNSLAGFSFGDLTKGKLAAAPTPFGGLSFGGAGAASLGFGAGGSTGAGATGVDGEDEEYVPPKPEVREIKEEGSVFTTRCKLFYKAENQWKDKGVGNLHIKPISGGKFQLLIRADTNLGNILLNIMVTSATPFKQQKNSLTFVCIPSPPVNPKKADDSGPTAMLIRVKTEELAAELLTEIDKYKDPDHSDD